MQTLEEVTATSQITTIYTSEEDTSNKTYQSISDLLQDEQMFRSDQDPPVFNFNNNSEDLNSNFNLSIMEFSDILSDDYISKPEEIEMFKMWGLNFDDDMKKEEHTVKSPSPIPVTAIIPTHNAITPQKTMVVKKYQQRPAVSVTVQEQPIKIEDHTKFDLINFITNEVRF